MKIINTSYFLCCYLILLSALPLVARSDEDTGAESSLFVLVGIDRGNDLAIEDETGDSDEDLDLGDGALFAIGYEFYNSGDWKTRVSIGYKRGEVRPVLVDTTLGNVPLNSEFETFPLDFLLLYDLDWFEIGAGVTVHINPRLNQSTSSAAANASQSIEDIRFDNQAGFIAQAEFNVYSTVAIGVRYTNISYSSNDSSGGTITLPQSDGPTRNIHADSVGIYARVIF